MAEDKFMKTISLVLGLVIGTVAQAESLATKWSVRDAWGPCSMGCGRNGFASSSDSMYRIEIGARYEHEFKYEGLLVKRDPDTGRALWRTRICAKCSEESSAHDPLIHENLVIAQLPVGQDNLVVAVRQSDGQVVWEHRTSREYDMSIQNLTLSRGKILIGANHKQWLGVQVVDATTGREETEIRIDERINARFSTSVVRDDANNIFAVVGVDYHHSLARLDPATGAVSNSELSRPGDNLGGAKIRASREGGKLYYAPGRGNPPYESWQMTGRFDSNGTFQAKAPVPYQRESYNVILGDSYTLALRDHTNSDFKILERIDGSRAMWSRWEKLPTGMEPLVEGDHVFVVKMENAAAGSADPYRYVLMNIDLESGAVRWERDVAFPQSGQDPRFISWMNVTMRIVGDTLLVYRGWTSDGHTDLLAFDLPHTR